MMKHPCLSVLLLLLCALLGYAQEESEPNNTFQTASPMNAGQTASGTVSSGDRYDYYKTLLPADGTVTVYIEATHAGGSNGSFSFYAYDKSHRQIAYKGTLGNRSFTPGETFRDTIRMVSREADSLYLLPYQGSSRKFDYTISYEVKDQHPSDPEPNGARAEAVPMVAGETVEGKIGYVANGVVDRYDYYSTVLPENGTLKINVDAIHTGGSNGTLALYVYDRSGRQIAYKLVGNTSPKEGDAISDEFEISSRSQAGEIIYFLIYQGSSRSFAYKMRYEVIDQSPSDAEPNGTFPEAGTFNMGEVMEGQLGYVANGVVDRYDYYKTLLPASGTVRVYLEGTHTGGSNGSFSFYAFDKSRRQIAYKGTVGNKTFVQGEQMRDTIDILSQDADSIYLLVYQGSSRSFSYSLSYEVIDQHPNDAEPNGDFRQAIVVSEQDTIRGQLGYVANGVTDRYDYFKTLLPASGTVRVYFEGTHTGGSNGSFSFYAYDKSRRQLAYKGTLGGKSLSKGETLRDTIDIVSQAADSIYLLAYQGSNRTFAYTMRYEVIGQHPNDMEPNGSFPEAVEVDEQETAQGLLGYVADGVTDRYDYYKTLMPASGTVQVYLEGTHTGGSNGSFSFYAYDKSRRQIAYIGTLGGKSLAKGETLRDTIRIESRAADSLYLLVYQGSSRSFAYTMRYEVTDRGIEDPEPNDSFADAALVSVGATLNGMVGYIADGRTDHNDYYYMAVPSNGNINIYVEGLNTSAFNTRFALYAYDKNRRQIAVRQLGAGAIAPGETLADTVALSCVTTDSVYLLVYQGSSGRSFQYQLVTEHIDRQPKASFGFERMGHEVGFRAEVSNADDYYWDFGDGTTGTGRFPMKTYGYGQYTARLIATNSVCGLRDTAEHVFDFKGVEYFTPASAGKGGDGMIQVFGGGFTENTVITLSKGGNTLQPDGVYASPKGTSMTATFDLHFAEEGEYDVTILIPGEDPLVYPRAFKIEGISYPFTWSDVTGPDEWRVGRDTRFNLVVGNNGNVTASGVIVGLLWPKRVNLTFEHNQIVPDPDGTTTIVDDDGDTFTIPNSEIMHIYDELDTATPIDSFKGQPYDGYMRMLMIPHIPAGTTYELPFNVRATGASTQKFITFTLKPNYFGSCETPNYTDVSNNAASEMIDLVDMAADNTKNVPLQLLTKTLKVGQKHLAVNAKYAGAKFWSWWDGYDMTAETYSDIWQDLDAANEYALKTGTEEMGKLLLGKGVQGQKDMLSARKQKVDFINKRLANNQGMSSDTWMKYQDKLMELSKLPDAGNALRRLERLEKMFDTADKLKTLAEKREALLKAIEDCPELADQLKDLLDELDKELNPRDEREKETQSIGSMDPNAIYGPSGVGTGRFVNAKDRQSFLVTFENVDTATAAAQIVRIVDTLDVNAFDLSSFEFGNVTIGKDNYRVPKGRKEFVLDLDPVSGRPLRVRVNAALDTLTGIINWLFVSIDPATGDLPVLDGFLPPNVNFPDGEGSVSYSVNLKAGIADGTAVRSQASIIFDENEPILTNIWQNTTDLATPQSTIFAEVKADTVIHLRLSGSDAGSGLGFHHVYFSADGGEWFPLTGTSADTLRFVGEPGSTYSFYVTSDDRVGNRERKLAGAEATVSLSEPAPQREPAAKPFIIAPNPSSTGAPSIISVEYTGRAELRVANAMGQEVVRPMQLEMHAGSGTQVDLTRLGTGIYFLVIRTDDGKVHRDKLIIHKQ